VGGFCLNIKKDFGATGEPKKLLGGESPPSSCKPTGNQLRGFLGLPLQGEYQGLNIPGRKKKGTRRMLPERKTNAEPPSRGVCRAIRGVGATLLEPR